MRRTTVANRYHLEPGWEKDPRYVYIGRPSKWGNPFKPQTHGRRGCINLFRQHLREHPRLVEEARRDLVGKTLVCFCAPKPCHGDILAEVAEGMDP